MDLGFFESSRLRFWLWIWVPAVVVVAVTVASMTWLHREHRGLVERQALLADLPMLDVQVRKTDAVLKSATPAAAQAAQATEELTRRLDQIAKNAGLAVRAVKFGESAPAEGGLVALQVSVQIQGPLRAVVQWLDEIQKPGVLLAVGQAELLALSLPPDETVTGDLTLVIYLRST
jgi:hypothetical protein